MRWEIKAPLGAKRGWYLMMFKYKLMNMKMMKGEYKLWNLKNKKYWWKNRL